jgi:4-hydroxy-tetrahydrodipicolinate reductase
MDAEKPGVVVTGVSGRMGRMVVSELLADGPLALAACLEQPGHAWIGQDIGLAMGGAPVGVKVEADAAVAFARARAVIDFTAPGASAGFAALAATARIVHVVGTTGFEASHLGAFRDAARRTVIVRAGNMSLGVNLLAGLVRRVAASLGDDWDCEIVEAHHRMKVDAPSGTALMLGEAAAAGREVALDAVADRGRDGMTGPRQRGAIGFSAIRGGDIVGEHDVIFAGAGERVVLRHVATDRAIFARGALRAAHWGLSQPPGEYDMSDVLGL